MSQFGLADSAAFRYILDALNNGYGKPTLKTKEKKINFFIIGYASSAKMNIINLCLNTIAFVENLKILNYSVIYSRILVVNSVRKNVELIVLIIVHKFVIVENANHAKSKDLKFHAIVRRHNV